MASLKCSNCGCGIHYHDEADGTQLIAFKESVWNKLLNSDIPVSRYMLDGTEDYLEIWKCKNCETLHIFNGVDVSAAYRKTVNTAVESASGEKYVGYVDTDWGIITEEQILGSDIVKKYPDCKKIRLVISDAFLYLSCDEKETFEAYEMI